MAVKKLKDKRIVLTKSLRENDEIKSAFEEKGVEVLQLPLIEVQAIDDPDQTVEIFQGIARYDWVVFSSVNGVKYFFETFFRAFKDIRSFGPSRVACVGNQTAAEVRKYFLEVDLIPQEKTALKLAEELIETGSLPSAYVLWVSGDKVNKEAVGLLEGKGEAIIDVFRVYSSHLRDLSKDPVAEDFRKNGADAMLFASPSAVDSFVKQVAHLKTKSSATSPKTISLGPVTTENMKKLKVPVDRECKSPEAKDVVKAFASLV